MDWFIGAIKNKYAVFSGRARRAEYWYFALYYLIFYAVLCVVDVVTGTYDTKSAMGLLSGLYALILIIPSLAVSVRRLHDTGRSGWWLLISFLPLVGFIVLLVFFCQDSHPGANQYGPNPKGVEAAVTPAGAGT
jgi:uncharacterized membrane protein YhaH (DUF805 family)